ncbi:hypothetical protein HYQ46_009683 [Verticillium longisporum]|nr:hypothetical protein HYQ46_009683 [Verticillium longisporum]
MDGGSPPGWAARRRWDTECEAATGPGPGRASDDGAPSIGLSLVLSLILTLGSEAVASSWRGHYPVTAARERTQGASRGRSKAILDGKGEEAEMRYKGGGD